ncbi:MAG: acetyl-CoA carboxylase biotin carboxyl carrier protein subunit [Bacteroidetes bacterium]|nr:acetyl-CoA carboxylase biotin carboxyl carrier protein subunit [Bacteroidota bacterium]
MKQTYKLSVGKLKTLECSESDAQQLDAAQIAPGKYHVLRDGDSYQVEILKADFLQKNYTVSVNNNPYTVKISDSLDQLIQQMGFESGSSKHINAVKAPMPGLIIEINVSPGQAVQENDPLLILSAMKMENSLLSPREGVIKSVAVAVGAAVDKGQLLIEFE